MIQNFFFYISVPESWEMREKVVKNIGERES